MAYKVKYSVDDINTNFGEVRRPRHTNIHAKLQEDVNRKLKHWVFTVTYRLALVTAFFFYIEMAVIKIYGHFIFIIRADKMKEIKLSCTKCLTSSQTLATRRHFYFICPKMYNGYTLKGLKMCAVLLAVKHGFYIHISFCSASQSGMPHSHKF